MAWSFFGTCRCHWHPRPGCAPGGAVTFFCVAKRKSPKKRPPPLPVSSAYASETCGARARRVLAKLACGSNNASPDPPATPLLGASRGGPMDAGSAARSAPSRLGRECPHPNPLPGGEGARQWVFITAVVSTLVLLPLPLAGEGWGEGLRAPRDARRSRADVRTRSRSPGPPLNAPAMRAFGGIRSAIVLAQRVRALPRQKCVAQVAPKGSRRVGAAFLWVTFLWLRKEK